MVEIRRRQLPMVVTLIALSDRRSTTVLHLEGISPKNYRGKAIYRLRRENTSPADSLEDVPGHPEMVDRTGNTAWSYDRDKYWLVLGRRFDLVQLVHKSVDDYEASMNQHREDRAKAIREFEDNWDKKHPSPTWPDIHEIVDPHLIDHIGGHAAEGEQVA